MIIKSIVVALPPDDAFKLFTEQISEWWPAERRHTNDSASKLFLQADGRFFERASDGREVDVGKVVAWEPPQRIVLDFYIATGPEHPTKAEITFAAEGCGTRVSVMHSAKPESEDLWDDRARRYAKSWELVLAALRRASHR